MNVVTVVNWTITMVNNTHYNLTGVHNATVRWPTEPGEVGIAVANDTQFGYSDYSYWGITYTPTIKSDTSFTAIEHLVVNSTGYIQEAYNNWDTDTRHAVMVMAFFNFTQPYPHEFAILDIFGFGFKDSWSPLSLVDTSDLSIGDDITLYTETYSFGPFDINATVVDEVIWTVAGQSSVDLWKLNHTSSLELIAAFSEADENVIDYNYTLFEYFTKDTGISVSAEGRFEEIRVEDSIIYEKIQNTIANVTATNIDLTTGETTVLEFSTNLIFVAAIGIAILTGAIIARHKKKL